MADTLKRSQVLQQQIDNLQKAAPPPLTQAERDQIMKGRRKQDDIDAGRRAISDREDAIGKHNTKVNDLLGKLDIAIQDEGGEATRREREANANPLLNTMLPVGVGAAGGAAIGEIENRILHEYSKGNAEAIKGIAKELGPVDNLTNSQMNRSKAAGAAAAAEKYAPSSPMRQGGAIAGRLLSYGLPAGAFYNEYTTYRDRAADPAATDADRMANQRIANGLLGVSTGMGVDGGMRFFFPSRHDGEGEAMARINAARDYAKRMDAGDAARGASGGALARALRPSVIDVASEPVGALTAPPSAAKALPSPEIPETTPAAIEDPAKAKPTASPGSHTYMKDQAKALGLKGYSKLNKTELSTRLAEAMAEHGGKRTVAKRLPKPPGGTGAAALAGGLAYALTPDRAEAADGTSRGGTGEALTNAGIAGGGAYGVSRLAQALGPAMRGAIGMGDGMAPASIDAMTDYSPDEAAQGRNMLARNLPGALRGGAVEDAYQMAQVPQQGDRSDPAMLARAQADQAASMPMASASALEIPQGIPAPDPSGASPYAPAIMGRLQRMQQTGATPEQIASWLNQAVR